MFSLDKSFISKDTNETLHSEIGETQVRPYKIPENETKWVAKIIPVPNDKLLIKSFQEIVLGFTCKHEGILPLESYFIEKEALGGYKIYLKFPRMKESYEDKLRRAIQNKTFFLEKEIIKDLYSLVCSIDYLHGKDVAHRNIKPSNILFDEQGSVKLTDIGVAKYVPPNFPEIVGKNKKEICPYIAPEMSNIGSLLFEGDLYKGDIWSLGMVFAEACLLQRGFGQKNVKEKVLYLKSELKKLDGYYGEKLLALLSRMLELDPIKRIALHEIKTILEDNYNEILVKFICIFLRL